VIVAYQGVAPTGVTGGRRDCSASPRILLRRRQATVPEQIRVTLESTGKSHYLSRIHVIGISGRETSGHTQAKLDQLSIVVQFGFWTLSHMVI
jgi:hypothetical protein